MHARIPTILAATLAVAASSHADNPIGLSYASGSTVVDGVRYFHTDVFAEYANECDRALLIWEMSCTRISAGPLWHHSYPDTPSSMKPLAYTEDQTLFNYDSFICIGGREQRDVSGLYWLTPDYQDGLVTGNGTDIGGIFLVPPIGQWSFAGPDRKVRLARFTLHESNWNPGSAINFRFRMASGSNTPAGGASFYNGEITVPFTLLSESTTAVSYDEPSPEPYCYQYDPGTGGGGGGGGGSNPPGGIPNPNPADFDFNRDGKSDLMWHLPSGGNTSRWYMDGVTRLWGGSFPWSTFGGFKAIGTGDQNYDGFSEVVFWHPEGRWIVLWSFNGDQRIANPFLGTWPTTYTPIAVADFTGDGRIDLLERFANTYYRVTPFANYLAYAPRPTFTLPAGMSYVTVADVTGDGIGDLILRDGVNRFHAYTHHQGSEGTSSLISINSSPVPSDWKLVGTGDLDGDHDDDLIWHNTANGEVRGWLLAAGMRVAGGLIRSGVAAHYELLSTTDTDGDGDDDLIWRDTSNGNVYGWRMNGLVREEGGFIRNVSPAWTVVNR